MAKYLDENGLQTLIGLVKGDLNKKVDIDAIFERRNLFAMYLGVTENLSSNIVFGSLANNVFTKYAGETGTEATTGVYYIVDDGTVYIYRDGNYVIYTPVGVSITPHEVNGLQKKLVEGTGINIDDISNTISVDVNDLVDGTTTTVNNGKIKANYTTYTAGSNIAISADGIISATDTNTTYTAGNGISINENNEISSTYQYTLPAATGDTLGGLKVRADGHDLYLYV